jgi:hypothetical protein
MSRARNSISKIQRGGFFTDSYQWNKRWNPKGFGLEDNNSPSEIAEIDPRNRIATIERISVLGAILQNGADDLPLPIHSVKFSLPEA